MRLTEHEREAIVKAVRGIDVAAEVWLHGSRVDDRLKGGDIDLLILSDKIGFSERLDLLVQIKMAIGDQKIDLFAVSPAKRASDPFAQAVLLKALRL